MSSPNGKPPASEYLENRFHLLVLAFQRAHQLHAGARPRVPRHDHKPTRLALLEVMADTISWSVGAEEVALASASGAGAHGAEP